MGAKKSVFYVVLIISIMLGFKSNGQGNEVFPPGRRLTVSLPPPEGFILPTKPNCKRNWVTFSGKQNPGLQHTLSL